MAKKDTERLLWPEVTDSDFLSDNNVTDKDISEYNLEKMKIFSFNVNTCRQLLRLSDSLKPVERRMLYCMYLSGARPGTKPQKCNSITGNAMSWHPHSDMSLYKSLVGMAQPWKRAIPIINGIGGFGNDAYPEKYAHSRYTEATISKYAWECFFEDYNEDCVEQILNTACDKNEPMALPSKFPNIIINGGIGIAIGNSFRIPTYNVYDIISTCKRLLENPDHSNIYMIPDLPTGCDVIDDGRTLREICETGEGVLKMRSTINILDTTYDRKPVWALQVTNIPWLSSLTTINEKIVELAKKGILPIKDIQEKSYGIYDKDGKIRMIIDYQIIVDKAHDPNQVVANLYKMTELQKTVAINFKVVMEGLTVEKLNMRDLILSWIDERRAYKRRLCNRNITRLSSRIALLKILIHLLDKDNIEKTLGIIKNHNLDKVIESLQQYANMSSFQATKIAEMKLNAFTKDALARYSEELIACEKELDYNVSLVRSEKKIDNIILTELDDLKKYGSPRKSRVISEVSGVQISDTDHTIIITKMGMVKKLIYGETGVGKLPGLGAFKNADYPIHRVVVNNLDSMMLFDSSGKYSCIPIHSIDSTEPISVGNPIYDYTKLNGTIVSAFQFLNKDTESFITDKLNEEVNIITLTQKGYLKKTKITEFTDLKSQKNIRATKLKDDDALVCAKVLMDSSNIIVYTKKGKYISLFAKEIPAQSKDSLGLMSMDLDQDDECIGLNVIGRDDDYIVVVTEKGNVKKCDMKYFVTDMKRKTSSYVTTLDDGDNVIYINGAKEKNSLFVCTRTAYQTLALDTLPDLSRKAKCQKLIAVPQGNNIISVAIT